MSGKFTSQAQELLKQLQIERVIVHAPTLFHYELVAVSRKAVYQKRVTSEESLRGRDQLLSYPVTLHYDVELLKRGYELASQYNRPTAYDAQYLALAERLACDFWTADERLFNTLNGHFAGIHWIGNWQSAP